MERDTRQRQAIRHAFVEADRPISPREVLSAAQAACPGLGLATVYRTLKALLGDGWLTSVELPGEATRYERSGKRHHHHFHCQDCGRIYEMERCPQGIAALVPAGFALRRHEVILYGLCSACSR
jgi:Fur family transcriptional regulator, ferric uptake regulator